MSEISCTACQELRESAPDFTANGVTTAVCSSLAKDTGLDSTNGHNDATDLHLANDCLIGRMQDEINAYDVCDWKEFMKLYANNDYEVNKGIICALGGLWNVIHELINALGGGDGFIPVIRRYQFTVPAETFMPIWRSNSSQKYSRSSGWSALSPDGVVEWYSGGGPTEHMDEMWIRIPVSEMSDIIGVWTQTWVVPNRNPFDAVGKQYVQTVNVQEFVRDGDYLNVNFDTYIIAPERTTSGDEVTQNGGPYPVTIDFLVVGKRSII